MINFDDLEDAFLFVSSDQPFMNFAVINKKTGKTYFKSEMTDLDELPDDVESDDYIPIPHKNDLNLGKDLVFDFVSKYLPEKMAKVSHIFRSRGAYSRFKSLLDSVGSLNKWYEFEDEQTKSRLRQWGIENGLEFNESANGG